MTAGHMRDPDFGIPYAGIQSWYPILVSNPAIQSHYQILVSNPGIQSWYKILFLMGDVLGLQIYNVYFCGTL